MCFGRNGTPSSDKCTGPFLRGYGSPRSKEDMSTVYKHYRRATDLGTPEVTSDKDVTLTIDGKQATVPDGTTVLRAAALSGINIPKLCASDMLGALWVLSALLGRNTG